MRVDISQYLPRISREAMFLFYSFLSGKFRLLSYKRERKTLVKKSSKVFKKIDFQNDDQMFEDAPNINFK